MFSLRTYQNPLMFLVLKGSDENISMHYRKNKYFTYDVL